ncbi:MAG TPA: aminopeptidase [Candidatus Omnitrophota bacterium]|nr:aminopeptidase [Candidatus Omnitrophota bacterium]
MEEKYQPSEEILEKYADVLVNFALNSGNGIKRGEVVILQVPECAKPLLIHLRRAVLKAGANPLVHYLPDGMQREFFELANEEQLRFFPDKYLKGRVEQVNHFLTIIAETNKHELEGIEPKKIMENTKAFKPYLDWRRDKETSGKLTWTLAMYATPAMAKEAGLSLEECWNQIIKACYLDEKNPVERWKQAFSEIENLKDKLDSLDIEKLEIKSGKTHLFAGIGKNRKWMGGSGRNIPSFELFISPDCRKTEGYAKFDQPLYRHGNLIKNVYLEFKGGKVVKASAEKGEEVLKEMINVEGADMIGEFSLTDRRFSRIDKFMAETLFDENFGGNYGNFHIALGEAYKDSYPGDASKLSKKQWKEMGYNESAIHTDIISTENREVTAHLMNGQKKIIYKDGRFVL